MSASDRLHPSLLYHLANSLGWTTLRPVQESTIGPVLDGHNVVVLAPTAGGKTEAAFFPLLSDTLSADRRGLSVLYLSPIRALLNNQEPRLARYYGLVGRRVGLWHGDVGRAEKRRLVGEPPDCLLTTPESLEAMLVSPGVPHAALFAALRAVVVDEVHAFAGDDRGWHLLALLDRIQRVAGRDLQRVGLSATVGNPDDLLGWLAAGSTRPRSVIRPPDPVPPSNPEVQIDYVGSIPNAARVIASLHRGEKRLVFCDSRSRVEQLATHLRLDGVTTHVTHSSLSLDERRQAERAFASGRDCVIVATSTLELGVDVGDLDRVIQIDAPPAVASFLQRMGRTGRRAGATRNCLFLATSDDALLRAAGLVRLWQGGHVEPVCPPARPLHIFAQQVMALALQEGGLARGEWRHWIGGMSAFAGIPPAEADQVLDWLLATGVLWDDGGVIWLGRRGQEEYGRRNFLELCSVFSSPPEFAVVFGREELGSVHEHTFAAREDGGAVVLLLAGRAWRVTRLDWGRRVAQVEPAAERGRSVWRGGGQPLPAVLCRSIRRVLASDEVTAFWSRRARERMTACRAEYPWLDGDGTQLVVAPGEPPAWWTFAGGRANAALAARLAASTGRAVAHDNFAVRFEQLPLPVVEHAIAELRGVSPGDVRVRVDAAAITGLKFADCLPPEIARSLLEARLTDADAVAAAVGHGCRTVVAG